MKAIGAPSLRLDFNGTRLNRARARKSYQSSSLAPPQVLVENRFQLQYQIGIVECAFCARSRQRKMARNPSAMNRVRALTGVTPAWAHKPQDELTRFPYLLKCRSLATLCGHGSGLS